MTRVVELTAVQADEGTIVLFKGQDEGHEYSVAIDHRVAQGVVWEIARLGPLTVEVEDWQIVARLPRFDNLKAEDVEFMCVVDRKPATRYCYEEGTRASGFFLCDDDHDVVIGDRKIEPIRGKGKGEGE